jgi:GTP-binding protein
MPKSGLVVAIDGPAGAGKSTLARSLAAELGVPYINTGLMYRSVASTALRDEVDPTDGEALERIAHGLEFSLDDGSPPALLIEDRAPGAELTTTDVEAIVSMVARHPGVRSALRAAQRRLGAEGSVMEGRDIGTVVFPDADVKVFLLAEPDERISRRERERGTPDESLGEALERRDALDAKTNPLVPAADAHVVDTTGRAPGDVLREVLDLVEARRGPRSNPAAPTEPAGTRSGPPRVAIVGRQNVGKSTLLNRLLGSREAIAHEDPGVTRDRLEREISWDGSRFLAIDTGGYMGKPTGIDELVTRQADRAMAEADVVALVVDAAVGVQEEDATLARRLRGATVPVVLVANKVDSERQELLVGDLFRLGLGEPVPVSALHGRGAGELLDLLVSLLPEEEDATGDDEATEPVFSIVGRPNVGKSSLFNRLVGEDRSVVYQEAGTTRDSVDAVVDWEGQSVRFVDTAGFRRPSRAEGLTYYGFLRTVQAIDRSHVAALVISADEGVTTEDRRIAARVAEAGRGLVVVANKWDLVPSEDRAQRFVEIKERVAVFPVVPVLRTSAKTGMGVAKVPGALLSTQRAWSKRVPTSEVNRAIEAAQHATPPPRQTGKIRYAAQVGSAPPRFVLFSPGPIPTAYARFLEHRLREAFELSGVPIRFTFRRRRR